MAKVRGMDSASFKESARKLGTHVRQSHREHRYRGKTCPFHGISQCAAADVNN